jgi:Fic family protein
VIGLIGQYDGIKEMLPKPRQQKMLNIIMAKPGVQISEIKDRLDKDVSIPTLNRDIATLLSQNYLLKSGKGRATSYKISPRYSLLFPLEVDDYFDRDPDARNASTMFNHDLLEYLEKVEVFLPAEVQHLQALKKKYQDNIANFPAPLYEKELERLTIELSWKSSQIEGNTYSLLETERLFLEKEEADGKPHGDAIMLLNHKHALHFLLDHSDIGGKMDVKLIEEIHGQLTKDLRVSKNIRSRSVGITGTAYKPLDNQFQVREALARMCSIINAKDNGFEKALIAVAMISYIQPFEDGNKRTGRMISSALLISDGACPLSYRSVDSLDYKKAMLLFYEQNNLAAFKKIFMEQNEFSVNNYFS